MKILLIEDDDEIRDYIKANLIADSYSVDVAGDGAQGSYMARISQYDAIVLDYSLPTKDGVNVCEEIRKAGVNTPIIFLTIRYEVKNKVNALNKGADDYMTKPFSIEELKARIMALNRRPKKLEGMVIKSDDLVLDLSRQAVYRGDKQIYLTRKSYVLFEYLMRNKGFILSRGSIMEYVWDSELDPLSNTIETHILNLRKKINNGGKRNLLRTVPGRGYMIEDSN